MGAEPWPASLENRPRATPRFEGVGEGGAEEPAGRGGIGECAAEYAEKGWRHRIDIGQYDRQGAGEIEHTHDRHNRRSHPGNTADTTQDDQAEQECEPLRH